MLDIDLTLVYQIIGFFVLLIILNRLLYAPILKVLNERDARIAGTLNKASETEKEVEQGMVSYEQKLKEALVKGHEGRAAIRQVALDKEKEILAAARSKASAEIAAMKKELAANKQDALAGIERESKSISASIAEKILERKVVITLFVFVMGLMPIVARATEEAAHGGGHEGGGSGMLWKVINFVILAIGIGLVWKFVLSKLLVKRSADIAQAIEDAKAAKEAADVKAAEYQSKIDLLETRINELHEELKQEGRDEGAKILAEAERASNAVMESAKAAAASELKKARIELRKEAADLAVKMAEDILKKELKDDDQKRLVKGYLEDLRLN